MPHFYQEISIFLTVLLFLLEAELYLFYLIWMKKRELQELREKEAERKANTPKVIDWTSREMERLVWKYKHEKEGCK